ncbi:MAG: hypothetical protein AAGG68_16235 [Bacteroidota bacterium]
MNNIWNQIKGLFNQVEESSSTKPAIHEVISRSAEEKEDYEHWKKTIVRRRLSDWLSNQYALYKTLPNETDEGIDFLNTPSMKGFVIHFHQTQYSKRDAVHFLDFLKERVSNLNYRTQLSDVRTYSKPQWVESIQKHYLKPRTTFEEGVKIDQQYGNVSIDLVLRDDRPHHLRFSATSYSDHLYEEAKDFGELVMAVS